MRFKTGDSVKRNYEDGRWAVFRIVDVVDDRYRVCMEESSFSYLDKDVTIAEADLDRYGEQV